MDGQVDPQGPLDPAASARADVDQRGDRADAQRLQDAVAGFVRDVGATTALHLQACVHCGLCAEACQFYLQTGDPKYTPILKLQPFKRIYEQQLGPFSLFKRFLSPGVSLSQLQQWEELLYDSCTMCGRCTMICPMGIDIASLVALTRHGLAFQREVARLHAIFGGKNPHPNMVVGGAPSPISVDPSGQGGGAAATALNVVTLQEIRQHISLMQRFVSEVYLPDTQAIAGYYKDWFFRGEGVGNFMTFGDFPSSPALDPSGFFVPRGVVWNRDLSRVEEVDLNDPNQIQEFVSHAFYRYSQGDSVGLHPYLGETVLDYTGPTPPYDHLDVSAGYSWLKAPRLRGRPVEVGPLARIALWLSHRHEPTEALVSRMLDRLELPTRALFSTMGRTAARALEAQLFADQMMGWLDQLVDNIRNQELSVHNPELWNPRRWPSEARGVGFMEAPRGALAHWVVIKDGKIDNYQAVVPSTWNAGPRDSQGAVGPYEAALMDDHVLLDPERPLEIQRTIHSFDPCIACAVHVLDGEKKPVVSVRMR